MDDLHDNSNDTERRLCPRTDTGPCPSDVDVAYRESVARGFSSPELFAPVSDLDPFKAVIDSTWPAYRWLEDTQEPGNNGLLLQSG